MAKTETIILGGGCFWCTEAAFQLIKGVTKVTSGYAGGSVSDPDYYAVATGKTGHAEVVQIEFNPTIISLVSMLDIFWAIHDPTTLNRQGPDAGTDYRSIILYTTPEQRAIIEASKTRAAALWPNPIVTEVGPLAQFYPAEMEHQNFYKRKASSFYCQVVINPKLEKLRQKFTAHLAQ